MDTPFVSYATFNRLGLTQKNLTNLLDAADEFEMHIVDNHSTDGTWEYIMSLDDDRIVKRGSPYPDYLPPVILKENGVINYQQLKNGTFGEQLDFVPGCLQALRPELLSELGYWCEECHYGDAEISVRINNYSSYKAGFVTTVEVDMSQTIPCDACQAKSWCQMAPPANTCFTLRDSNYKNEQFAKLFEKKYYDCFKRLASGEKSLYCPSVFDQNAMQGHTYDQESALENFSFNATNANNAVKDE